MPPKPRATRKPSVSKDAPPKVQTSMPPPPDPPQPQGILVPEVTALSACLRNAVVKTGQIYGFYADTRKLAIHKHAPYPPRSLTTSLGREVEKYDQLCDAIESHLLRAIAVLQRDLSRAEDRLKAASVVPMVMSPLSIQAQLPLPSGSPSQSTVSEDVLTQPDTKLLSSARRPSTISLSSLHRPPFPHKLDLSSTALRINPDDPLTLQSGLASPVTLAPKSSISRHPPDLLHGGGQPVDIDLTLDDSDMAMSGGPMGDGTASGLGSSADKPIELDLDIDMDLFGDASHESQHLPTGPTVSPIIAPKQEDTGIDLSLLGPVNPGSIGGNGLLGFNGLPPDPQTGGVGSASQPLPPNLGSGHPSAPSPTSLLAGLHEHPEIGGSANFDFDLNFLEPAMDMQMDDLFNMADQPPRGNNSTGS